MTTRLLFSVLSLSASADLTVAQTYYELIRKIENPAGPIGGSGDQFGISMVQVGEKLVIGAYRDDTGAENAGAAYVFDREGNLLKTIHNPTPERDDWFGFRVTEVQDTILIAARNDSTAGFESGSVYLYDQQGNLLRTISNPTPGIDDDFGIHMLGIGDKILVTSIRDDTLAENAGAVYLFDKQGSLLQEFFSPNPVANGFFGRFFDNLGDEKFYTSALAYDDGGVMRHGATYLFDLEGNVLQTFPNPRPDDFNFFGARAIALESEHVAISAFDDSTTGTAAGTVYLFDGAGNLEDTILNPTPEFEDWFGRTMTGVGHDQLLIGSIFDDTMGLNSGAAYLYSTTGNILQTFLPPEPAADGHFGQDLGTFDDLILIGSNFDGGFTGPGAVYVYAPLPPLVGDYNADQIVDQADLDLVLLNWGTDASDRSDDWIRNLPHALIDQQELDDVLLNWGRTTAGTVTTSGVPEPTTLVAGCYAVAVALVPFLRRR